MYIQFYLRLQVKLQLSGTANVCPLSHCLAEIERNVPIIFA